MSNYFYQEQHENKIKNEQFKRKKKLQYKHREKIMSENGNENKIQHMKRKREN